MTDSGRSPDGAGLLPSVEPVPVSPLRAAIPNAGEPFAYGIGSTHWPGVGKAVEEQNELGTVLGKLMGSGGARYHWSGDLVRMMQDEIADVQAALSFLVEANPELNSGWPEFGFHLTDGTEYMSRREEWKLNLFRSWQRGDRPADWPQPEDFGLPSREAAQAMSAGTAETQSVSGRQPASAVPQGCVQTTPETPHPPTDNGDTSG